MQHFHNYYGDRCFVQPTWGRGNRGEAEFACLPQKFTQNLDPVTEHATLIVLFYHDNRFLLFGDKLLPSSIIVTTIMTQFNTMTAYFVSQNMVAHCLKVLSLDVLAIVCQRMKILASTLAYVE